jgi:hypothetical protein
MIDTILGNKKSTNSLKRVIYSLLDSSICGNNIIENMKLYENKAVRVGFILVLKI